MNDKPEIRWSSVVVGNAETTRQEVGKLHRAVHKILQIRGRKRVWILCRIELRPDFPVQTARSSETDSNWPILVANSPHECSWHLHVRVRGVDAKKRSVGIVPKNPVGDTNGSIVPGHAPHINLGPHGAETGSFAVVSLHEKHVLRKLSDCVATRR